VRDREAAFFTMILPVLLLVVFGSAFSGTVAPGIRFSQYFLAGMIASGIVYTSFQNLAIAIPQERDDGTLKRLQGTPMPKSAYFRVKWRFRGRRSVFLPDSLQRRELAGAWELGRVALVLVVWAVVGLVVALKYFRGRRRDDG